MTENSRNEKNLLNNPASIHKTCLFHSLLHFCVGYLLYALVFGFHLYQLHIFYTNSNTFSVLERHFLLPVLTCPYHLLQISCLYLSITSFPMNGAAVNLSFSFLIMLSSCFLNSYGYLSFIRQGFNFLQDNFHISCPYLSNSKISIWFQKHFHFLFLKWWYNLKHAGIFTLLRTSLAG